jgi:hypothetical protein
VHFARITDAILAARLVRLARNEKENGACRITIAVGSGSYAGSFDAGADPALERFPLLIDVPDITLRGALRVSSDAVGRASDAAPAPEAMTSLVPNRPLDFLPTSEAILLIVGHLDGFAGHRVVIEGFRFQSGRSDNSSGGIGIIGLRVRDLVISGNRFEAGLGSGADIRSSTGQLVGNFGVGLGTCGFCLNGPGNYVAAGNYFKNGGLGGIYLDAAFQHIPFSLGAAPVAPVEPDVLPSLASVTAVFSNNLIEGHAKLPIGFGFRILALGNGASTVPQTTQVSLIGNEVTGNTFGLIIDAGFPAANTALKGDVNVALSGNTIAGSCQSNLLVAFTRHTRALGLTTNPFLLNSTYRLDLAGDLNWEDAWFAHPAGLGNSLIVDGESVPTGVRQLYDPLACPGAMRH